MNRADDEFWDALEKLPPAVQELARRRFALFRTNPEHPSFHFKKVGRYWSVRINLQYRAVAINAGSDLLWLWIGKHDEYQRYILS